MRTTVHLDPLVPAVAGALLAVVVVGFLLRRFGLPLVIAYLVTGVILGPDVLGLITDAQALDRLGAVGVLLLLFFVGTEVDPHALLARWRVALIGTGLQILGSLLCLAILGFFLDWPLPRVVLVGFVISLSSTAVVLRLLRERVEDRAEVGSDVTAVLLAQDLAIVPMTIVIAMFQGEGTSTGTVLLQLVGGVGMVGLVLWLCRKQLPRLPFSETLLADAELQVFVVLLFLFGLSAVASVLQVSAALGAFVAGILVGAARETKRFHESLKPFEVVFVASFFLSIGMLMDLDFLRDHWPFLLGLVVLVFVTNTLINACMLRALGSNWRRSLYAASFLAQVGEFSFVLALLGYRAKIIGEFGYQTTVALISLSLLLSPAWIALVRRATREERTVHST